MSDKTVAIQVGPGGPMLLTIVFVLLKVFGYISWSWWWIFSPLWIGAAIVLSILAIVLIIAIIAAIFD
jgi:hypothetical protein